MRVFLSDIGRIGFAAMCVVVLAVFALERFSPGTGGATVSAQRVVLAAVACAALGLLAKEERGSGASWSAMIALALCAGLVAGPAVHAALQGQPALQTPVTALAVGAIALASLAAYGAHAVPERATRNERTHGDADS